jgi:hypothetical protein
MIFTIKNLSLGPYNETICTSLKAVRRTIRGESARNLRIKVQKSIDHSPEQVVILEGPRGGLEIHLP